MFVIIVSSDFYLVALYQLYMFVTTFGLFCGSATDPIENVSRCAFLLIIFSCFSSPPSPTPSLDFFFVLLSRLAPIKIIQNTYCPPLLWAVQICFIWPMPHRSFPKCNCQWEAATLLGNCSALPPLLLLPLLLLLLLMLPREKAS